MEAGLPRTDGTGEAARPPRASLHLQACPFRATIPANFGGDYEAQSLAGRSDVCFSAGLLRFRAGATGQNLDSRGHTGGSGAGGDLERARLAKKVGDVPGFSTEVLGESGGRGLR